MNRFNPSFPQSILANSFSFLSFSVEIQHSNIKYVTFFVEKISPPVGGYWFCNNLFFKWHRGITIQKYLLKSCEFYINTRIIIIYYFYYVKQVGKDSYEFKLLQHKLLQQIFYIYRRGKSNHIRLNSSGK